MALRMRMVAVLLCGGAMGLTGGCNEHDSPMSFLPEAPEAGPAPMAEPDAGMASGSDAGGSMEGASFKADWCKPAYTVRYNSDIDPKAETYTVTGTVSRSVDPKSTDGQISIAVLTQNPVPLYLGGMPPEVPVVQLLVRDCAWTKAGDKLEFTIENIPKKSGDDYYFASFFDTEKKDSPVLKSGDITAAVGLTDVPRLPAKPSGATVKQDLDLNTVVP